MAVEKSDTRPIRAQSDVVLVRQAVRDWSKELGFSLVDQTKVVTAASELARNTLDYGGGGVMILDMVRDGFRRGLRITFADEGPGIPDLSLALKDGYTTGGGLGLGLSGAKRLMNDFEITSVVGQGTTIVVTRWK